MDMAARASTSQSSIPRDENVVLEVEWSSSIPPSSAMDTLDLQQKKVFEIIRKLCQQADQSESCRYRQLRGWHLAYKLNYDQSACRFSPRPFRPCPIASMKTFLSHMKIISAPRRENTF